MARKKGAKNRKKVVVESPQGEVVKFVSDPYTLIVKVLGRVFTSKGDTFEEALAALKLRNAKGMSVWKVEHNNKTTEKIIGPAITSRIFNTMGMSQQIALKNFKTIFGI